MLQSRAKGFATKGRGHFSVPSLKFEDKVWSLGLTTAGVGPPSVGEAREVQSIPCFALNR